MREIRVLVTLQVDECEQGGGIDSDAMQEAAVEAVESALRHAENNGFSHQWANELSVGFVDAVAYDD